MTHHTGSDEGRLSDAELAQLDAAFVPFFRVDSEHGCYVVATVERILAARAAAPDALRERVEALCDRYDAMAAAISPEDDWGESVSDTLAGDTIRAVVSHVRAALTERPTDGAGT